MKFGLGLGLGAEEKFRDIPIHLAGAGQSNMSRWNETTSDEVLINYLQARNPKRVVTWDNGAWGGSSVLYKANNEKYWWDERTDVPGNAFTRFQSLLTDSPDVIVWDQGEADGNMMSTEEGSIVSEAEYETYLKKVFAEFRTLYNCDILIIPLGMRANTARADGWNAARRVQFKVAQDVLYVHFGATKYHRTLEDTVHQDYTEYPLIAADQAPIIDDILVNGAYQNYFWNDPDCFTYTSAVYKQYDGTTDRWEAIIGDDYVKDAADSPVHDPVAADALGVLKVPTGLTDVRLALENAFTQGTALTLMATIDFGPYVTDPVPIASRVLSLNGSASASIQLNTANRPIFYRNEDDSATGVLGGGDTGMHLMVVVIKSLTEYDFYVDDLVTPKTSNDPKADWLTNTIVMLLSRSFEGSRPDTGVQTILGFTRELNAQELLTIGTEIKHQANIV